MALELLGAWTFVASRLAIALVQKEIVYLDGL